MLREDSFKAILYATDTEKLWMDFKEIFTYVEAAGGCVIDDQKLLLIRRFGIYDLPKGHLEKKETPESGGIREVEEECGVKGLNITGVLQPTYHIYAQNGDLFLKKTFWYTMSCSPGQHLTPQTEEGIEEVFWLKIDDLSSIFNNTYDSLKEIFKEVIYRLRS
ncbi:NUDIX domain-containing protein [Odoribacter sp. OttesenSCG-928-J03]|nr:NUDIX domain-containing protein [Odoribacter sp. OttesenSCG-928-J03]